MRKDVDVKVGLLMIGLLVLITAVTLAQNEMRSYMPVAFGPDLFFVGTEEQEPNNSFDQANGALHRDQVYSALANDADDYFYFITELQGEIAVSVSGLSVSEAEVSLYRDVEDATPELVKTADVPPDFLIEAKGPAGKYYAVVHVISAEPPPPRLSNNIPYTLSISYASLATPTLAPGETPRPSVTPTLIPTVTPTRADGATSSPTIEVTDRATPGVSPTPSPTPTRGGDATTTSTPDGTESPEPTEEATPGLIPALENENFEDGAVAWEQSSSSGRELIVRETETSIEARSGEWVGWLGGEEGETSRLGQLIEIPDGAEGFYLTHYAILESDEDSCKLNANADTLELHINGEAVEKLALCHASGQSNWSRRNWSEIDLSEYAGETIFLEIVVINNDKADSVSSVYLDDFSFSQ